MKSIPGQPHFLAPVKRKNAKQGKEAVTELATESELRPLAAGSEEAIELPDERNVKSLVLVVWEDITAFARVEIPDDFEKYRLIKKTVGLLWSETDDYIVLVQDYDATNKGKGYRHNDFHIIPKGVVRSIRYLGEEQV